ncbi:MAG: PaaI family thioesterase [Candidatus Dormibacteria bacterium]
MRAHLDVEDRHTQPAGLVHGGVYCAIVETLASVGASLTAGADGRVAVGLENHTSFLRPVRQGTLDAVAHPVNRGRLTHLWEVLISDDRRRPVARGSLRLAILDPQPVAQDPWS